MLVDPQKTDTSGKNLVKDLSDSELLRRFAVEQDEASFTEIVERHGQLVWSVCRRVLADQHDEEDAFQATFMVLARKASTVRRRTSLASWLYGVAYRVAVNVYRKKHRHQESALIDYAASETDPLERLSKRGDEKAVDEELHALPKKYRSALILYYLKNRTHQEIADELHLSASAVDGRLKRGRAELRRRLVKRGISLSCFATIICLAPSEAVAGLPATLIESTVEASVSFARGDMAPGGAVQQLALTEITQMTLFTKKLATLSASALVATALGIFGLGVLAYAQEGGGADDGKKTVVLKTENASGEASPNTAALQVAGDGTVRAVRPGDSLDILNILPPNTRLTAEKINEQLNDETQIEFIETPLREALDFFSELHNMLILIDGKSLDDEGITKDEPITMNVDNVSLRSALHLMLDPLYLDYTIHDDVLMITTRTVADEQLDTRMYTLLSGGNFFSAEEVIEMITKVVEPETWEEVGGAGVAIAVPRDSPKLIIRQTQRVHEKVVDFLYQLQRMYIKPLTSGGPGVSLDAPRDDEVMHIFEKVRPTAGGFPMLHEAQRNIVSITKDKIADYVDPPRVYPLIGPAQLHHVHSTGE